MLEVSSEQSYSGENSVKFAAQGSGYNRNYISLDLADYAEVQKELYGRMMIWVNTPNGSGADFTFAQAEGKPKASTGAPADTTVMYRYRVNGSNGNVMANYDTWIDANGDGQTDWLTDCWDHSTRQLPTAEWACVEWHFDSDANELMYWLNGEELNELHIQGVGEGCVNPSTQDNEWTAPANFLNLHLGIEQYHGHAQARTVYIDDVAVDSRPIGCP